MSNEPIIGQCGCGKPLYAVYDLNGRQIGVTHTTEDEDWHSEYFSNMRIQIDNSN